MLKSLLVIVLGVSTGAWLRWWRALKLNLLFPAIPASRVANMSADTSSVWPLPSWRRCRR